MSWLARLSRALGARVDRLLRTGLMTAWAHADDALLQQIYVTPRSSGAGIEVQLIPGAIIAPEFLALLDANGDGVASKAEADAHLAAFLAALQVEFERQVVTPRVVDVAYPDIEVLRAGGGTIAIMLEADAPSTDTPVLSVTVTSGYAPLHTVVQHSVTLQADEPAMIQEIERSEDGTTISIRYYTVVLALD